MIISNRNGPWRLGALAGILLSLCATATVSAQASPQTRGAIHGTVTNAQGRVLSAVVVRIPDLGAHALTTDDGTYRLPDVPPGTYALEFERIGYDPAIHRAAVAAGRITLVNVTMTVRAIALEHLVVTGTARAQDPLSAPADVAAVGGDDLRASRDASLGGTLARTVPGVTSIQTGSQAGVPVLRGLSGTRVRVLQNNVGQEFYQFGVRHHPTTSLAEAERVEVVRGAASILYGSDALGGAVNVLTRRLPVSPDTRPILGGEVQTQLFSNNDEAALLVDLHGALRGLGARAGFEIRDAGNIRTPDQPDFYERSTAGTAQTGVFGDPKYTGELPHTGFDQWSIYGQLGGRGRFGEVEAFFTHWDDENDYLLPSGGPSESTSNPPLGAGVHLAQTNLSVRGALTGNRIVVRPTLSFQRALRQAPPAGTVIDDASGWAVDLRKNILTARVEVAHEAAARLSGTTGVEVTHQDGDSRGPVALEPGATITNLGVFAFENWERHALTLSAGARLDHRRRETEANSLSSDPASLDGTHTVLSGSMGAVYRLGASWALAANATSGFRAPTVFELFADGEHGGVAAYQKGNPDLEPERSLGLDLALRVRSDRLRGEVSGYWTEIRNYVYLANTGEETEGGLPIYQAGQTDATIRGIEGTAELALTEWLALGGHFSVVRGTGEDIEGSSGGTGGPLPLLPASELGGFVQLRGMRWGPLQAPTFRADLHHARPKNAAGVIEPFSQFDDTPFGTASTLGYTLVDLEARAVVEWAGGPLSVAVTVTNLLDTAYRAFLDTYKGYALSMGRNVGVRVRVPLVLHP